MMAGAILARTGGAVEVFLNKKNNTNMCTEEIEKYKASKSAEDLLEDVIDTLCEVGNGVDDEMLHDAANRLFAFRDLWKEESKRIKTLEAVKPCKCGSKH